MRQAQAPDVQLACGRLSDGETRDPEMVDALDIAVQESAADQIRQEPVNRADWQSRQTRHLFRGQPSRGFAEEMQKPQPALKGGNVVITFGTSRHKNEQK